MECEEIFEARVETSMPPTMLKSAFGDRVIFDVLGGKFSGQLDGEVEPVGGDWALAPGDGWWHLDIRSILRLTSGSRLHARARGRVEVNAAVQKALQTGGEIQYGDTYFVSAVEIDCADSGAPALALDLSHSVCVTQGRFGAGWVEYKLFRVNQ